MNNLLDILLAILSGIGYIALVITLITLPTMWLWNWLMPEIFGLVKINFFQTLGLIVLSTILFNTKLYSKIK